MKYLALLIPLFSVSLAFGQNSALKTPTSSQGKTQQSLSETIKEGRRLLQSQRFFSLGFLLGGSSLVAQSGNPIQAAPSVGVSFAYRFKKRFASQVVYAFSNHNLRGSTTPFLSQSYLSIQGKAYLYKKTSQKNFWRRFNPFGIAGASQNYASQTGEQSKAQVSTRGLELGGGIEVPLSRQRAFIGLQTLYKWVPGAPAFPQGQPGAGANQWNIHMNFGINL